MNPFLLDTPQPPVISSTIVRIMLVNNVDDIVRRPPLLFLPNAMHGLRMDARNKTNYSAAAPLTFPTLWPSLYPVTNPCHSQLLLNAARIEHVPQQILGHNHSRRYVEASETNSCLKPLYIGQKRCNDEVREDEGQNGNDRR